MPGGRDINPNSGGSGSTVAVSAYVSISFKEVWKDSGGERDVWKKIPGVFARSLRLASASAGGSSCRLDYRYGPKVRQPGTVTDTAAFDPKDLSGYWLRVQLVPAQTTSERPPVPKTIFIGRVEKPIHDLGGDKVQDAAGTAKQLGVETFVAIGGERILEKTEIFESTWATAPYDRKFNLQWTPGFNDYLPDGRTLKGNRTAQRTTVAGGANSFVFGDTSVWDFRDIAEYVLQQHATNVTGGVYSAPLWRIGGQADNTQNDLLRKLSTAVIPVHYGMKAYDLLTRVIPASLGLDFYVRPIDGDIGFELDVFSVASDDETWTGRASDGTTPSVHVLPKNPRVFRLNGGASESDGPSATGDVRLTVEIEKSRSERFDSVVIAAKRSVVCMSYGNSCSMASANAWTSPQATAYKAGAGQDDPADEAGKITARAANDAVRTSDDLRDVFQSFSLSVTASGFPSRYIPRFNADGSISDGGNPDIQTITKETKHRLPLLEGWDYTVDPPVRRSPLTTLDHLPLLAIVQLPSGKFCPVDMLNSQPFPGQSSSATLEMYPAASVGPLDREWGVRLRSSPNHLFGRGDWGGAKPSNFDPLTKGILSGSLSFTIAFETDYRLYIRSDLPTPQKSGDNLIKVIHVEDAEFHWLAPRTILGIKADGTLQRSPLNSPIIVRNDVDKLNRMMPGAMARYLRDRKRATVTLRGLELWDRFIGFILEITTLNGIIEATKAPITSVDFDFDKRTVRLATGQAE